MSPLSSPGRPAGRRAAPGPLQVWTFALEYEGAELREADPIPLCQAALAEAGWPAEPGSEVALVVAELWHNALEHGVLGCDSALKERPGGFSAYYAERDRALARLNEGRVSIELVHAPDARGGRLVIRVTDSGPGFVRAPLPRRASARKSGRGLLLVESICEELEFEGRGNSVRASCAWRGEARP